MAKINKKRKYFIEEEFSFIAEALEAGYLHRIATRGRTRRENDFTLWIFNVFLGIMIRLIINYFAFFKAMLGNISVDTSTLFPESRISTIDKYLNVEPTRIYFTSL